MSPLARTLSVLALAAAAASHSVVMAAPMMQRRAPTQGTIAFTSYDGGFTACGTQPTSADLVACVNDDLWSPTICNKPLNVTNAADASETITVPVVDRCPTPGLLVLSPAAFQALGGTPEQGQILGSWELVDTA